MNNTSDSLLPVTLYMHKFIDGKGGAYTAFVAADSAQWELFAADGYSNLEPLKDSIVMLVPGHEPTPEQQESAKQTFLSFFQT